jgi:hypothetical protein
MKVGDGIYRRFADTLRFVGRGPKTISWDHWTQMGIFEAIQHDRE